MNKLIQVLTVILFGASLNLSTVSAQTTYEIDAPVIFYTAFMNQGPNGGFSPYLIGHSDIPYWEIGTEGTNGLLDWPATIRVTANPSAGTVSLRGQYSDLKVINRITSEILAEGITATYEMNLTGITFTNGDINPGLDPEGSGAEFIAIGDLGTAQEGNGTVTYNSPDPAVFGGATSITRDISAPFQRLRDVNPKWSFLLPPGETDRYITLYWGEMSAPENAHFEPFYEFAAWFMGGLDEPFPLFDEEYILKGDIHAGVDLQPITPIVECIEDIDAETAIAVFSYENENPFQATIPIGFQNGTTNVVVGTGGANGGQPTVFEPGTQRGVFEVEFNKSGSVAWQLGYNHNIPGIAVANADTPRCDSSQKLVCVPAPGSSSDGINSGYIQQCTKPTATVELDGTESSTPFAGELTYEWSTTCNASLSSSTAAQPDLVFSGDTLSSSQNCMVSLTVSDGIFTDSCSTQVVIEGCEPICADTQIFGSQLGIDSNADALRKLNRRMATMLAKEGATKRARRIRQDSKALYAEVWASIWTLPSEIQTCEPAPFCVSISTTPPVSLSIDNTQELQRLLRSGARRLKRLTGDPKAGRRLVRKGSALVESSEFQASVIPESNDSCL